MAIFIEVVSTNGGGPRFQIKEGMIIGRVEGDIIIQDPKISSKHAQVSLDSKGQLILVDLDSANGLRLEGHKVKKLSLFNGVSFEIGRTRFKVEVLEDPQIEVIEEAPPKPLSWRTILVNKLMGLVEEIPKKEKHLERFSPPAQAYFFPGHSDRTRDHIGLRVPRRRRWFFGY